MAYSCAVSLAIVYSMAAVRSCSWMMVAMMMNHVGGTRHRQSHQNVMTFIYTYMNE
jgi:hypothetical protein